MKMNFHQWEARMGKDKSPNFSWCYLIYSQEILCLLILNLIAFLADGILKYYSISSWLRRFSFIRHNSVPEGVTVITPSRRIVPTRLVTSSKTKDNLLFKNAPVSITGSAKTRGVWGEVANRDFSQKNLSTMK